MTDWRYPRGQAPKPRVVAEPQATLPSSSPPRAPTPQKPQKRAGRPSGAPKPPKSGKDAFVGGVTVVVPFDALCPDNQKYGARAIRTPQGKMRAGLFLSADYREAKERIEGIARRVMRGMGPCASPVTVLFECWMPDLRQRDMMNYAKLLCDALKNICFADDSLIHEAHWHHKGVNRESPCIMVTVTKRP